MPIYEYECTKCGHRLEALQKTSEAPLKKCPECHKPTLEKLVSATSFQLKGTGWYETDFKGKKKLEEKTKSTGTGSGEKKTETKSTGSKKDKAD